MASKYNIAQCLLNEEKHTPEEIQVLLKQGEENEGAMVRLLPKVETATHQVNCRSIRRMWRYSSKSSVSLCIRKL